MNKKTQSWSQRHYEKFQIELKKLYDKEQPSSIDQYIEQIKILEQFSFDKNRFFCLFSQIEFFPLYLSKNVKTAFGYDPDDIYKRGLLFMFKITHWKQLPMALKINQWGQRFRTILGDDIPVIYQKAFFCGVKLKDSSGKFRTLFIKQKILTADNNKAILSFMDISDITPLVKSDFLWARFTATKDNQSFCRAFFQNSTKKEYADILSPRELEILKLVIEKKNNTEISALLNISKNTVERHRKNMIARTGVTDMTALIQICNLCGMI